MEVDVHQCWDSHASARSPGKLCTELLQPRLILPSCEHCQTCVAQAAQGTRACTQRWTRATHQLRCDWIHMPDTREQETQTHTQINSSSPGAGFTLYASEIMVGSSSELSRIKTHRTNITSIDFYLGLFLTIFHKSILLRNSLCLLNIVKNVAVESLWHTIFPILPRTPTRLKRLPRGAGYKAWWAQPCCFCKTLLLNSQTPTNSSSPPGALSSLWCPVGWASVSAQGFVPIQTHPRD